MANYNNHREAAEAAALAAEIARLATRFAALVPERGDKETSTLDAAYYRQHAEDALCAQAALEMRAMRDLAPPVQTPPRTMGPVMGALLSRPRLALVPNSRRTGT